MADEETGTGSYRELLETRRRLRERDEARERQDAENARNADRNSQSAATFERQEIDRRLKQDWTLAADQAARQQDTSPPGGSGDGAPDAPERPDPIRRLKDQQHQKNIADHERHKREEETNRQREEARLEYQRQEQDQTHTQQPRTDQQGERDGVFRGSATQEIEGDQRERNNEDQREQSDALPQGREQTDRRQSTIEREKSDKDYEQEATRTERRDTLIARWQADRARERGGDRE
jgi:hypothetical protein